MAGLLTPGRPGYTEPCSGQKIQRSWELCRTREKLVSIKTLIKNATHSQISTFSLEIASVFTDVFGESGMKMLRALLEEIKNPREEGSDAAGQKRILAVLKKLTKAGLKEARLGKLESALSKAFHLPSINAWMVEFFLKLGEHLDKTVKGIDDTLVRLIYEDHKIGRQVMLLIQHRVRFSCDGVPIVAEICDVKRFPSDKRMGVETHHRQHNQEKLLSRQKGLLPSSYGNHPQGEGRFTGTEECRSPMHWGWPHLLPWTSW